MSLIHRVLASLEARLSQPRLSLWRTCYVNCRLLPFSQAIHFPIFIYGRVKLYILTGSVEIKAPINKGMIKIGMNTESFSCFDGSGFLQICNGCKITFNGPAQFGINTKIRLVGANLYAGFHNADKITAMQNIRILGTKDFVNPQSDIFAESSHGMAVLSCIAMNRPGVMTGTAPEASFWLLRSEDEYSEHLVEQDYWAAAVEYADSVGVDVLNTSLGYYAFDDKSKNYKLRNLDGHHALMSRQASRIADKGMVLVCSAGNSGAGSWKKITPPGDAENVLTVGAVDKEAVLAPFSSVGNTADHRIKPDIVAVGLGADVIRTDGNQGRANGTSFASPIMCGMVACLWQACPELTAKEVIELVRRSGDRADFPDNIYGYGVPDMWKAYQDYQPERNK